MDGNVVCFYCHHSYDVHLDDFGGCLYDTGDAICDCPDFAPVGVVESVDTTAKVYGPYLDSTKTRRIVIVHRNDGSKTTHSYARWIMQQNLGRELSPEETVDHIDGDSLNDDISNLAIMSLADNIRKSSEPAETLTLQCLNCGIHFTRLARYEKGNIKQGKSGPYCGHACVRAAQLNGTLGTYPNRQRNVSQTHDSEGSNPSVPTNPALDTITTQWICDQHDDPIRVVACPECLINAGMRFYVE